ncbi:acyl carrier protein [Desulfonema magnum]|uniref:Acyl carrier protein n=1 Tax=Desulfonema magnum TaxID=45655 RepID=A0A975BQU7_9BACT|nr:acyl carrier protein [Desulfonema magnum]QTA90001.1 Putative acyl carrier protein [Desulfonema magnum]
MREVLDILKDIHPEHDFSESENFISDGLLDSFDIVTIVAALEEKFAFTIDGEDVTPENFMNLETLGQFVQHYLSLSHP